MATGEFLGALNDDITPNIRIESSMDLKVFMIF
jgi:hypothetical protein